MCPLTCCQIFNKLVLHVPQVSKQSQQWHHDKCKYEDTIATLQNKIELASLEVETKNTQFTQLNEMLG